uniref:Calcium/calmodulin-dependent protein kinase (CaM kinase) II n=1 Tax=Tetraselmis sp. GSL018 TaxID=582737 RepID=A0A061RBF3_9CHLO|mmetsp:Transcript_32236/g.76631  ORF Transcript_32236/g.76631 Transcript_32236/m.76631 type:complete len:197 (+) Transcript_32236:101-691(+)
MDSAGRPGRWEPRSDSDSEADEPVTFRQGTPGSFSRNTPPPDPSKGRSSYNDPKIALTAKRTERSTEADIVEITQRLLNCIALGDFATYKELCDPSLSCFEPEACGSLVQGLDFHKHYFDIPRTSIPANQTISSPHVKLLGNEAAVIGYTRLQQKYNPEDKTSETVASEETRVWQVKNGKWVNVHFHRSNPSLKSP